MRTKRRWYYLIDRGHLEEVGRVQGVSGILDMLRYDRAVLENNAPSGYYLLSASTRPTLDRWRSFGIVVAWCSSKATDFIPFEAEEFARRARKEG